MNILIWNAKRLGNPLSVRALSKAINVQVLKLIFLMESRLEKEKGVGKRRQVRFDNCFEVPR